MFPSAQPPSETSPHGSSASPQETGLTRTREQEAQQSLTTTRVTPGLARGLLLAFLMTLLAFPLSQWAKTGRLTGTSPPSALTGPALKQYAETLQSQSVAAQWLLPRTQALLTQGGAGNEQAYIGHAGWLYYRPDVDYVTGPSFLDAAQMRRRQRSTGAADPVQPDPLPALLALQQDLTARGIQLIVMPVPVKPMLEPGELAHSTFNPRSSLQNSSYAAFCDALNAHGIFVCDVSDALRANRMRTGQPQFLRTDTHWTPDAMEQAAQTLSQFVQTRTSLPPVQHAGYIRTVSHVANLGDIASMLRLPSGQTSYLPQTATIHPVLTSRHTLWQADKKGDVLLLGDSFSNVYSRPDLRWGQGAGFAEHLSFALQRPVDRIALNAGGSYAARQELTAELARGQDRLRGKRLVVYEFAMRDLSDGDWKMLPLPAVGSAARPASPSLLARLAAGAGGVLVQGTVQALTPAPRPGSTPYPDCIIALRLTHIHTAVGNQPVEDAHVLLWGMRDNRLTSAAFYAVGQQVNLSLVPWETVQEHLSGYQQQDFDDANPHETVYWSDTLPKLIETTPQPPGSPVALNTVSTHFPAFRRLPGAAAGSPETHSFLEDIRGQAMQATQQQRDVVIGRDNWLFYMPELRSQCAGQFWGPNAYQASQALQPEYADPLPAILDFKRQLDRAGIELLLVPVPAKVAIYPEKASRVFSLRSNQMLPRVDVFDQAFYSVLQAHGVNVLDLAPLFLMHRRAGGLSLYDKQDTHWSLTGSTLAAQAIARRIGQPSWLNDVPKHRYRTLPGTLDYTADLWGMLGDKSFPKEIISKPLVVEESVTGFWPFQHTVLKSVQAWQESPIVLLGDSYCLGLQVPLTRQLGFSVDIVTTPGSGGENARISLARRRDLRSGKRLLIWCFSVREFTEERGWRTWPLVNDK